MIGKYFIVEPRNHDMFGLGRSRVLLVESETVNQVTAHESESFSCANRVHKSEIIREANKDEITPLRIKARDLQNEYREKQKQLFDEYHAKMISIGEE